VGYEGWQFAARVGVLVGGAAARVVVPARVAAPAAGDDAVDAPAADGTVGAALGDPAGVGVGTAASSPVAPSVAAEPAPPLARRPVGSSSAPPTSAPHPQQARTSRITAPVTKMIGLERR